jgi:hypothetical protein
MIELLRTKIEPNIVVYVTAKIGALTKDGAYGAFAKSECAVKHNGAGVLPIYMFPTIVFQQNHGYTFDALWMIDNDDLVLLAHDEDNINWQASFDILR